MEYDSSRVGGNEVLKLEAMAAVASGSSCRGRAEGSTVLLDAPIAVNSVLESLVIGPTAD